MTGKRLVLFQGEIMEVGICKLSPTAFEQLSLQGRKYCNRKFHGVVLSPEFSKN